MNFDKTIAGRVPGLLPCAHTRGNRSALAVATVMLPVRNPVDQHLPDLDVRDRDFLDSVDFQTGRVQHFLDRSRGTFEDAERYHLVKPNWHLRIVFLALDLHHFLLMHGIHVFAQRVGVVVREGATQIHNLILVVHLQQVGDAVDLGERVQSCQGVRPVLSMAPVNWNVGFRDLPVLGCGIRQVALVLIDFRVSAI